MYRHIWRQIYGLDNCDLFFSRNLIIEYRILTLPPLPSGPEQKPSENLKSGVVFLLLTSTVLILQHFDLTWSKGWE